MPQSIPPPATPPPTIRLFVDADLSSDTELAASEAQAHHLGHVMRRRPGDVVAVFNGRDGEFLARITALNRGVARLAVEQLLRSQTGEPDLWLAFALLKRHATDLVVQKATELGVIALLPVITERTGAERVNLQRLRSITVEAAEQCERLTLPDLQEPQSLAALLRGWPTGRRLFAAVERGDYIKAPSAKGAPAALLVGPEGGFTPAELDALRSHALVQPVSLGPRILRAETAAIVGLALLQVPACPNVT
jgi:16S rRNA (uracil1498-N3)-methyltransferase